MLPNKVVFIVYTAVIAGDNRQNKALALACPSNYQEVPHMTRFLTLVVLCGVLLSQALVAHGAPQMSKRSRSFSSM
jgi:hypothetical protein